MTADVRTPGATPPGRSRAPSFRAPSPVTETWLSSFERLSSAENLARLDTDRELVDELREANFEGIHWNYYATELVKYGLAVIKGWTMNGLIFEKVKKYSFGDLPRPLDRSLSDADVADTIAADTVTEALIAFRDKVLIPGTWDPARGASIKTFFVGQCLKQYSNAYRRWHREAYDDHFRNSFNPDEFDDSMLQPGTDIADGVAQQDAVRRVLESIKNPQVREVFVLVAAGHTYEQIAGRLAVTPKTIERIVYNERQRQEKERDA